MMQKFLNKKESVCSPDTVVSTITEELQFCSQDLGSRSVLSSPPCPCSLSPPQTPLQKLLFSATLTQNPEKLQQLGLHQPRLFSSTYGHADSAAASPTHGHDRFNFPQGLTVRAALLTFSREWN